MRSGLGPMMHQWPQVGPTQRRQLRQEEGHGGCRPRSAEVTRWPHGEAALSTGLTAQPLKSHPEQGCPRFPEALCPFKSDRMAQFVNSISFHLAHTSPHPSTPYPTLRSWWLFLSLPTMPGPCTSPSRHTQPVQGLWDPWHPPLLEYKSLINNKRPPKQSPPSPHCKNSGPGGQIMKVSLLSTKVRSSTDR